MRIAHFVSGFPVLSETFVRDEISAFHELGFSNRVVSLRPRPERLPSPAQPEIDTVVYPRVSLPLLPRGCRFGPPLLEVFAFPGERWRNLLLKMIAPQVIQDLQAWGVKHCHAHFAHYPATLAWICSQVLGVTFSFNAHSYDLFHYRSFLRQKVESAKAVFPISDHNREWLLRISDLPEEEMHRVRTLHCGIDLSQYPYRYKPLHRSPPEPILVGVGRLVDTKGFETLLRAFPLVLEKFPQARLEVIGEGPERENLTRQAQGLGISNRVSLLGALDRETTKEKQRQATLVVQPCQEGNNGLDGIPVVLMEAMALGTPVVSTEFAAIPELIESGVSGILVPPKDPVRLSQAILSVLEGEIPLEQMCLHARKTIEDHFDGPKNYHLKARILKGL